MANKTMKAARLIEIGDFRVRTIPVPKVKGKELLVKIGACGICGSDIPRIFESGAKGNLPITLGHEFSGTIVSVGDPSEEGLIGKKGAFFPLIPCFNCNSCESGYYAGCSNYNYMGSRCDGGFAEYCVVPTSWHFVESNDVSTSLQALAMVEPACVAQHANRQGGVTAGQTVVIFGAGPIGIMTARWAKIFGAKNIIVVDIVDEKVKFANDKGVVAINSLYEDVSSYIKNINKGELADVVIEGTGTSSALNNCIECVKAYGTVVLLGNPIGTINITQNNYSNILRKEIEIKSVWNSHYANMPINEWKYTVEILDSKRFTVDDLITHRVSLDELPGLCKDIYEHKVTVCKAICDLTI